MIQALAIADPQDKEECRRVHLERAETCQLTVGELRRFLEKYGDYLGDSALVFVDGETVPELWLDPGMESANDNPRISMYSKSAWRQLILETYK